MYVVNLDVAQKMYERDQKERKTKEDEANAKAAGFFSTDAYKKHENIVEWIAIYKENPRYEELLQELDNSKKISHDIDQGLILNDQLVKLKEKRDKYGGLHSADHIAQNVCEFIDSISLDLDDQLTRNEVSIDIMYM